MEAPEITRRQFTTGAALAAVGLGLAPRATAAPVTGAAMRIAILGDSVCIPDPGHEAACLLIDGKHMVDTGWCAALGMRQYGFDPLAVESVILTHCHHDHYLGLPQLLFYLGLKKPGRPLTVAGPAEHLPHVLRATREFLQISRFPEIATDCKSVPLAPGDSLALGDLDFATLSARHVSSKNQLEPALVFRVTDRNTGACAVFTGDTSHHPPIAEFARGAHTLIHDSAHTSARDAADTALRAGVNRLVLIHYAQGRASQLLKEAQAVFPNTRMAKEGETLEIPAVR